MKKWILYDLTSHFQLAQVTNDFFDWSIFSWLWNNWPIDLLTDWFLLKVSDQVTLLVLLWMEGSSDRWVTIKVKAMDVGEHCQVWMGTDQFFTTPGIDGMAVIWATQCKKADLTKDTRRKIPWRWFYYGSLFDSNYHDCVLYYSFNELKRHSTPV